MRRLLTDKQILESFHSGMKKFITATSIEPSGGKIDETWMQDGYDINLDFVDERKLGLAGEEFGRRIFAGLNGKVNSFSRLRDFNRRCKILEKDGIALRLFIATGINGSRQARFDALYR